MLEEGTPAVRLHGKGRKQRTVPQIRQWLQYTTLGPDQPLIPNRYGRLMTRSNVNERLALAVSIAIEKWPQLAGRAISPHTLRHSNAMHLLQGGVDITVIALWLGHESSVTTHDYMEADLAMKERALAAIALPKIKRTRCRPTDSLLKFLESL